jgi:hypothetical protein
MEDLHDKDLINRMKDVLRDYEEPYAEGAWEEFSGTRKSAPRVNWKWLSVAAMILVACSVWLFYPGDQINNITTVVSLPKSSKKAPLEPQVDAAPQRRKDDRDSESRKVVSGGIRTASGLHVELPGEAQELTPAVIPGDLAMSKHVAEIATPSKKISVDTVKAPAAVNSTFMDFLVEEQALNKNKAVAKAKRSSKWDFGVELLPTVSNSAVNLGAGLMTEYKLSEHFSVGSGISLVQLQAGRALTPGVSMLSSRQLQSVDANFRGIDIPLNLVYNINKSLYTSVGVSYFNVIQEDSKNTFIAEREVSSMATDPMTGLTANVRTFVSETMQEPSSEAILNGKSYLGFFNFSIGRKQEVFKKYNIFIEPFVKLPVGKLSQQDLQLMNGGVKFKVAF